MKPDEIPYNVSFQIGPDLREKPDDLNQMQLAVQWLVEASSTRSAEPADYGRCLSLAGVYARMVGDLDLSAECLQKAIAEFKGLELAVPLAAARLRYAHTLHWQEQFDLADALFADLVVEFQSTVPVSYLLDFVYQHAGKSKFDQKKYEEAKAFFSRALEIRKEKADASLIASTTLALDTVLEKIAGSNQPET